MNDVQCYESYAILLSMYTLFARNSRSQNSENTIMTIVLLFERAAMCITTDKIKDIYVPGPTVDPVPMVTAWVTDPASVVVTGWRVMVDAHAPVWLTFSGGSSECVT